MLSDSPPDRDLDWTESGIDGAWRFVNRLWRMITEPPVALPPPGTERPDGIPGPAQAALGAIHRTVAAVSGDLDRFGFNRAVARIRELTNTLAELGGDDPGTAWVLREGHEAVVRLIGPMMPHLGEELWRHLGHEALLCDTPWPVADDTLTAEATVTVAVQVNGKKRGTVELAKDCDEDTARRAALAVPNVAAAMGGKEPRKVIVVANRIVNVVV